MKKSLILLSIFVIILLLAGHGWTRDGRGGPYPRVWTNKNLPSDERNTDPDTADITPYKTGDYRLNESSEKVYFCFGGGTWREAGSSGDTFDGGVSKTVTISGASLVALGGIVVNSASASDASGASLFVKGDSFDSGSTIFAVQAANGETAMRIRGDKWTFFDYAVTFGSSFTMTQGSALYDDQSINVGNSNDVKIRYTTRDANANSFIMALPDDDATNVPVFGIGDQSVFNLDLGWFNGMTDPSIALISNAKQGYSRLYTTYDTNSGQTVYNVGVGSVTAFQVGQSGATLPPSGATLYFGPGGAGIGEDGTGEMYANDDAGNSTKISAHNALGEWEFYSVNKRTGQRIQINMMDVVREVERLSGKTFIRGTSKSELSECSWLMHPLPYY